MLDLADARWRKATDIEREFSLFELVTDLGPVLDVGYSNSGLFEVSFNITSGGLIVDWDALKSIIEEGRLLADEERALA